MQHRLFVGIRLSAESKSIISDIIAPFKSARVNWVPIENLHITIIPPCYESDVSVVKENLLTLSKRFGDFSIDFKKNFIRSKK